MKKIIIFCLLVLYPLSSFGAIDETKIDVYFANGILTKKKDAIYNLELLEKVIRIEQYADNDSKMYKELNFDTSYNHTYGDTQDLVESGLQMFETQEYIDKLIEYVDRDKDLISAHQHDLDIQVNHYKKSIRDGHRVLVVAHSQGNLFTTEAYRRLGKESKLGWMQTYFEAVSIASPDFTDVIKEGTPEIGWDNDVVALLGRGFIKSKLKKCNVRQVK